MGGNQSLRNRRGFTFEDCAPRRERSNSFFETESDGSIINCQYVLNDNLDIVRSYYSHINKQNINEQVSISQPEEARLLKIVQNEIDDFIKKMYQTLYG